MNQEELTQTIIEFYNEPFIRSFLDSFDERSILERLPEYADVEERKNDLFREIQKHMGFKAIDDFDCYCQEKSNIEKEIHFIFGIRMGHILSKLGRNSELPEVLLSSKID